MPLQSQNLSIPFSTGIDQKTDPFQMLPTTLLTLENAVYIKDKRLTKRNGFPNLTQLPSNSNPLALTTFKGNLTVLGDNLLAYNPVLMNWVDRGRYQGCEVSTTALANNSLGKSRVDAVKTAEGYVLACYLDSDGEYRYQLSDSTTSQLLLPPTIIPDAASARVATIGNLLVVLYSWINGATPTLSYIAIPLSNLLPQTSVDLTAQMGDEELGWDFTVYDNNMYVAWNGSTGGGEVRFIRLSATLSPYTVQVISTGTQADLLSATSNSTGVWVTWYEDSSDDLRTTKISTDGSTVITAEELLASSNELVQIASSPVGTGVKVLGEIENDYTYAAIRSDYVSSITCSEAGVVGTPEVVVRSLGLASKSFIYNDTIYFLGVYDSELQPTYFLVDENGNVIAKLAYSNGGGYIPGVVLPGAVVEGSSAFIGYMLKDQVFSVNPTDDEETFVYAQTGINLAQFDLAPDHVSSVEMAECLHISGGYVWQYDGSHLVEHNYHVFPDDIGAFPSMTAGSMSEQEYQYVAVYEWTDAQGNIHRSAPSLPVTATVATGETSVYVHIPTLRITYKGDVRIVIYRWSVAQQTFYQVTSVTSPLMNNPAVDSVEYSDTQADSAIIGNTILYTTGGMLENIAYPAASSLAAFKNRLMVLSSENRNLVLYSKQVFEGTPVEPSDLLSTYVAPTTGSQGSTGDITVLTAMDDKFIMFKDDAIFYLVGDGPNDTGADNSFSEPTFISSAVGCDNQRSLALIPQGLMFQSDKGIWLLGRGLETTYIGSPVEDFGFDTITSASVIPDTNEVRFTLENGLALMYDYYYDRWGTFTNMRASSSTIYQQLHTILTTSGQVRQESPGSYVDGTTPVTLAFGTAWINVAGVQGLERVVEMFILGQYKTPHKLSVSISYDYEDGTSQQEVITPLNYTGQYGTTPNFYGQGVYGGNSKEQERVFFNRQKVQAVKVFVQELFDPTQGQPPGEGLTLSGLNFTIGIKKGRPTLPARDAV